MRKLQFIGIIASSLALAGFVGGPLVPASYAEPQETAAESPQAETAEESKADDEAKLAETEDKPGVKADEPAEKAKSEKADKKTNADGVRGENGDAEVEADSAKETSKAAKDAIAKAEKARGKAGDAASRLSGLRSDLESARADYEKALKKVEKARKKKEKLEKKIQAEEEESSRALAVAEAADNEADASSAIDLLSVLTGKATFDDIDSREYLLRKVSQDRREAVTRISKLRDKQQEIEKDLELKVAEQQAASVDLSRLANAVAFEIERLTSEVRSYDAEAEAALNGVDAKAKGVAEAKRRNRAAQSSHNGSRKAVNEKLGDWYDSLDAVSDGDNTISYGEGADFALEEEEFVEKWGTAIGKFFGSGPLAPYGKTMATMAYKYKVDPRLCAAVSIIESSGGVYCIKPHNAWGWGAADSNPYGLASGWSSWEEAIEAWHEGMANSKTGLATAGTLDELGAIYCSTADWSANVATQMEKISKIAQDMEKEAKASEEEADTEAESSAASV